MSFYFGPIFFKAVDCRSFRDPQNSTGNRHTYLGQRLAPLWRGFVINTRCNDLAATCARTIVGRAWPPKPAPPHAVEEKGGGKVVEERDTQDTQSLSPETIRPRPESIQ